MTWIRTIPLAEADQKLRSAIEGQRAFYPIEYATPVQPTADGRTRYSDEVLIEAGLLTCFVWAFAQWFYRHRQRRWRHVAQRLVAAEPSAGAGRPQ